MSNHIKAGVIGGAGYTGGELIRLLMQHPDVELIFAQSSSHAGKPLWVAHNDLYGSTDLLFSADAHPADVVFLCGSHGQSVELLSRHPLPAETVIIDLSQDFRVAPGNTWQGLEFVYGLPELNRSRISQARAVANPGCFATALQLSMLPLAAAGLLRGDVHVQAVTGSTGAGQKPSDTTHFSWRNANHSIYKAFRHQHLAEIGASMQLLQPAYEGEILFIPARGAFSRGILATTYTYSDLSEAELKMLFEEYYQSHPFAHVVPFEVDVKQVVNTNNAFLQVEKHGDQVFVITVIDNLLKGASGQAVQNMNLMFGLPESAGLKLKPSAF